MKLEYFDDAFATNGLLLLYSGAPQEVAQLRTTIHKLLVPGTTVSLHDLDFVEPVANCEIIASSDARGRGVRPLTAPHEFAWSMPPSDWERAADLLEPFCGAIPSGASARFQYLHEHGGTEVVYSTAREW